MEAAIAAWRKRAAQLGVVGRGGRYPREMRQEAAGLCEAFVASDGSVDGLAELLGVAPSTLGTWRVREDAQPRQLVRVQVETPAGEVRLRLGAGEAVLTLPQLAELVRRLSC